MLQTPTHTHTIDKPVELTISRGSLTLLMHVVSNEGIEIMTFYYKHIVILKDIVCIL